MFSSLDLKNLVLRRHAHRRRRVEMACRLEVLEERTLLATIIDLGALPGGNSSQAHGINDFGQVVGWSGTDAFLYSGGVMDNLGTLPGYSGSYANGINDNGQVVGFTGYDTDDAYTAFRYSSKGGMVNLGNFGGYFSYASAINNSGQIVGWAQESPDTGGADRAFLYSNGVMTDLGSLGSEQNLGSEALGINNKGQVVGFSQLSFENPTVDHAFIYSNGVMSDLGTLPGFAISEATGINASGQIVGSIYVSDSDYLGNAFLYSNGVMKNLGTLPGYSYSQALGINDQGQAVGDVDVDGEGSTGVAFLYSNGVMINLNSLLPPNSGWALGTAAAINDEGQIVGFGNHNGVPHAYLLNLQRTTLSDVTFRGENGQGFYPIASDPTASGIVTPYGQDQWDPSLGNENPVLYSAGSTPALTATFQLPSSQTLTNVEARAYGPDGFDITATAKNIFQSGNELTLMDANMSQSFTSSVQYYPDFSIDWQLSFDGGNSWVDIGTSDNPLYVSAAVPIPDPDTGLFFLTVVNAAITSNLTSGTNQSQIVSNTWQPFTTQRITNYYGAPLTYYGDINTQNTEAWQLLATGDGQCHAWLELFLDELLINGVDPVSDVVRITPGRAGEAGFLVDNWYYSSSISSHNPLYPYVDYNPWPGPPVVTANNQYVWAGADVTRAPGIMGQNTLYPASIFGSHFVAYIDGIYYDPSYGASYSSLLNLDSQAISGFFITSTFFANGHIWSALLIRQNTSPSVFDLQATYSTYTLPPAFELSRVAGPPLYEGSRFSSSNAEAAFATNSVAATGTLFGPLPAQQQRGRPPAFTGGQKLMKQASTAQPPPTRMRVTLPAQRKRAPAIGGFDV